MTTLYKWTDAKGCTRGGQAGETRWGEGVTHEVAWGGELCKPGCLHAYRTALLAVLLDPAHGSYTSDPGAVLWECEGAVRAEDPSKVGCDRLTTLRRVEPPAVTTAQREWAARWLRGRDRAAAVAAAYHAAAAGTDAAAYHAASGGVCDLVVLAERAVAEEATERRGS